MVRQTRTQGSAGAKKVVEWIPTNTPPVYSGGDASGDAMTIVRTRHRDAFNITVLDSKLVQGRWQVKVRYYLPR